MINTSNEYKQVISGGSRTMYASESCTLASGESIGIPQAKLRGLLIEDDVSGKNSFDLGAVIINQCTIKLDNTDGAYSEKEFDQAKIAVKIGLQLSETAEWLNKGIFTAEPGTESGDVITIKAYDNMKKFDFPYSDSKLAYPTTLRAIVQDACDLCGVSLASSLAATEFDYVVNERPSDDALTFREVLHWVGEIACCWFRCNANGAMEAGFYDLAAYEDETEGSFHEIKNLTALTKATEDIIITGIRVEQESDDGDVVYQAGEDGYMLSVQGNQLINAGDAGQVATSLGNKLIGLRFRKLSVSHQSDPSIEAGDLAKVTDRKGNVYKTLLTSTAFQLGGIQKSACNAKKPSLNGATRFSESTKAYIKLRKLLRDEKTARETAVENLANTIANKNGLYMTTEEMEDGSLIYYAHNKPTIEESDIIWLMTAEAIGISTDGGETYPYGFVVDGELITRILQTEGVNADWILAGVIKSKDGESIVIDLNNGNATLTGTLTTKWGKESEDDESEQRASMSPYAVEVQERDSDANVYNSSTVGAGSGRFHISSGWTRISGPTVEVDNGLMINRLTARHISIGVDSSLPEDVTKGYTDQYIKANVLDDSSAGTIMQLRGKGSGVDLSLMSTGNGNVINGLDVAPTYKYMAANKEYVDKKFGVTDLTNNIALNETHITSDGVALSVYKYGRMCFVRGYIYIENTISNGVSFITGLPVPLGGRVEAIMYADNSSECIHIAIGGSGQMVMKADAFEAGKNFYTSFSYLTAE